MDKTVSAKIGVKKECSKDIKLEINIDRDTKNNSGSPEILDTILKKISNSDIFICDITLINNSLFSKIFKTRLTSNPNVLIELGYAIKQLGWERIVCIDNTEYGRTELLPFDIRGHRITTFSTKKNNYKSEFKKKLSLSISSIIKDYDGIIERFTIGKLAYHDKEIFLEISNFCTEKLLNDSISSAVNSLFSNCYYYSKWDGLIQFYEKTSNHFLNSSNDENYQMFLHALDKFRMLCSKEFVDENKVETSLYDYNEAGIEITKELRFEILQKERFRAHKASFSNETQQESEKRIKILQNELYLAGELVKGNYKNFVLNYKKSQL